MSNTLRTVSSAAVCVTSVLIAQLACGGHKDSLNENDRAQVAQALPTNSNTPQAVAMSQASSTPPQVELNANVSTTRAARMRPPDREAVESNKEHFQQLAREEGRTIGNGPDDTWLWVRTRYLLATRVPDSMINIDVDNGVVTLTGAVSSQEEVKEAESLVREIEGVSAVQNSLVVGPPQ